MLKTIVVPTDGSGHADKAVDMAADIAQKFEAKVVLVHALLHSEAPSELRHMAEVEHLLDAETAGLGALPGGSDSDSLAVSTVGERPLPAQTLERIGVQIVGRAENRLRDAGVAEIETRLRSGDAAAAILEVAGEEQADLIVIGTRGFGRLKSLLMGSVSHKVAQHADCTCMTVR